jgi:hypothetical protein
VADVKMAAHIFENEKMINATVESTIVKHRPKTFQNSGKKDANSGKKDASPWQFRFP